MLLSIGLPNQRSEELIMKRRIAIGLIFCGASMFAADELPKAETILDKFVEATGGRAGAGKAHGDIATQSPMGEIAVESLMSDYRKEGDLITPHKMVMKAAGQDLAMNIDKIEYNPDLPKDKFDPPAEVKALMNKPAK